jgi:antitoxin YefM
MCFTASILRIEAARKSPRGRGAIQSLNSGAATEVNWSVAEADIQIVSNEAGEPTAVIVPIELWREIASERETAYLLKSETMRQRLLAAIKRQDGISLPPSHAR